MHLDIIKFHRAKSAFCVQVEFGWGPLTLACDNKLVYLSVLSIRNQTLTDT